jgi:DNA-directed RNA polymerase specialized sigma24 family protein
MDADAIKQRDERFAARLKQRDESVLVEIDQAFAPCLRKLLRRARGKWFGDADVDEILELVLTTVWEKYDATRNASVRTFYFRVARARLSDRLQKNSRYRDALNAIRVCKRPTDYQDDELPDVELLRLERSSIDGGIEALIGKAVNLLTSRQRLAFNRRFMTGDSSSWAKDLAREEGKTSQYWRKASDEARQNVCKFLTDNGVQYSAEGGHYEIVKTRSSAG